MTITTLLMFGSALTNKNQFNNYKDNTSNKYRNNEIKRRLYKLKNIKRKRKLEKKNKKFYLKKYKYYFEHPSSEPNFVKLAFRDKEEYKLNELTFESVITKLPLTKLGTQLIQMDVSSFNQRKKRKKSTTSKKKYNYSVIEHNQTLEEQQQQQQQEEAQGKLIIENNLTNTFKTVSNLNSIYTSTISKFSIIDYNILYKKTHLYENFGISSQPTALFSISELVKRYSIESPRVKIQYVSINGFFSLASNVVLDNNNLYGGELLLLENKQVTVSPSVLNTLPSDDFITYKQLLQYNPANRFFTLNNNQSYTNIYFKKKLYPNATCQTDIVFLPIPISKTNYELTFNGSIMIAFNYMK